jgi:hypothetical protein
MYTLHGKTRSTQNVRFPHQSIYAQRMLPVGSPHTWQPFTSHRQIWMDPTAPQKKGSWYNSQHADWPIRMFIPSFSPKPTNEAVDLSQASVDDKLLGSLDPYHQHMIGTFNTCSRGPTHRSLTDPDGGYNLAGAGLPKPLPDLSNWRSYTFHLMAPHGFRLSLQIFPTEIKREQTINLVSGTSPLDFYHSLSSKHNMS